MKRIPKYEITLVRENSYGYEVEPVTSPELAFTLAKTIGLQDKAEEEFWLICLDTKNKPIGLHMVSRGSLNTSVVHPREVFKRALLNNACAIICMHNHPSGSATPSQNDIEITKRLAEAGELISVKLLDHIIVGNEDRYLSFKEENMI